MPAIPNLWLVCYDIADPRRLQRIARRLERHGIRLQYSVFAVLADRDQITDLRKELADLIDPRGDDIRIYPVARTGRSALLGAHLVAPDMLPHHDAYKQLRLPLLDRHEDRRPGHESTSFQMRTT